ncbi:hypothetical protein EW145_g4252 [Phellinidium pouzarii]|uniref:Protein kinase domain-containing protein n=1 Tax=Phellinidium pouzarii TaxID=167371 RepID=A0A4V3XCK0_9AGAM|nr:hypothetical protein EW145_g4252 [Phellinidium pouzarii]
MPIDIEKDSKEQVGGFLTFTYPKLEQNVDFETFRKTDEDWKKLVEWYNAQNPDGSKDRAERFVLLQWPRNPDGESMKITPRGKNTGNGCELWGATLYDFYRVHRIPSCPNLSTISTGSKLAAWMKEIGELDWAQNQLKQAELEEDPHEIYPFDIGQYLEVLEEQVGKGNVGKPKNINRNETKVGRHGLFPPSQYPAPWPLKPFSTPTVRFQRKLPTSFLPHKLIVHDPWNVLEVAPGKEPKRHYYDDSDDDDDKKAELDPAECKWGTIPDILRTYNLQLSDEAKNRQNLKHIGPRPEGYKVCPEAHLYITPKRRIGSGHHSFVYQVELELPRSMLVQPKICFECAAKEWMADQEILKTNPEALFRKQDNDLDRQQYYSLMFKGGKPFQESDRMDKRFAALKYTKQQNPPYCEHLNRGVPIPPSHKVSVTAKLSLPDGRVEAHSKHLRDEAESYQAFPSHMFEHWNGYNVLQPMHHPTPVGAVAPQFYGFYVPDKSNDPVKAGRYMSPILLLEHCGVQVNPEKLSFDHKQECFSLLRRLHAAGYMHNSVYQRNILMQYGPLQMSPFQRSKEHLRFRLIDYGRTVKVKPEEAFHQFTKEFTEANANLKLGFF